MSSVDPPADKHLKGSPKEEQRHDTITSSFLQWIKPKTKEIIQDDLCLLKDILITCHK